jgi:hypothetical protein
MPMLSKQILFLAVTLGGAAACASPNNVAYVSDERRIWVVRQAPGSDAEVYRCADGATPEQPPKPVCIRAPLARTPE